MNKLKDYDWFVIFAMSMALIVSVFCLYLAITESIARFKSDAKLEEYKASYISFIRTLGGKVDTAYTCKKKIDPPTSNVL